MTKIEILNMLLSKFKEKNAGRSTRVVLEVITNVKKSEFKLTIDDAIKISHELTMYKSHTIDKIANYARYRTKELGAKHINYFAKVCSSIASEPEITAAKSGKLRVWK